MASRPAIFELMSPSSLSSFAPPGARTVAPFLLAGLAACAQPRAPELTAQAETRAERPILEAFKPGTAPPDSYAVIGVTDPDGRPLMVSPEADRAVRSGTGGLY